MAKRKASAEGGDAAKPMKPRRKPTAVARTKDKTVIKMIEDNAANSPLLKMPGEIREKILMELVGGKTIHVYNEKSENNEGTVRLTHDIRRRVCFDEEQFTSQEQQVRSSLCVAPCTKNLSSSVLQYIDHHRRCGPFVNANNSERLHLDIMGVCRALFEETHILLWGTNNFALHTPTALRLFLSGLNASQKHKLRELTLVMGIDVTNEYLSSGNSRYIAAMQAVNKINIILQLSRDSKFFSETSNLLTAEILSSYSSRVLSRFLGLVTLDLKTVTVTISGVVNVYLGGRSLYFEMPTKDKKFLADAIRVEMLDPSTRSKLQAADEGDVAAEREARKSRAATSASRARAIAHRRLNKVCRLEKNILQYDKIYLIEGGNVDRLDTVIPSDKNFLSKHCRKTRNSIAKAKAKHERAIKLNEEYRTMWEGKEWWKDLVDFHRVGDNGGTWLLKPNLVYTTRELYPEWTKEVELRMLNKVKDRWPQDDVSATTDDDLGVEKATSFEQTSNAEESSDNEELLDVESLHSNDDILSEVETPKKRRQPRYLDEVLSVTPEDKDRPKVWYEDDKAILRRLVNFP